MIRFNRLRRFPAMPNFNMQLCGRCTHAVSIIFLAFMMLALLCAYLIEKNQGLQFRLSLMLLISYHGSPHRIPKKTALEGRFFKS
ncbi:hypothetical protein [Paenibacillus lactis]|uniref:hypothetical protein n=1 Tax=Paenibacillus lactis TaxID=228574 RepID=UPI0036B64F44